VAVTLTSLSYHCAPAFFLGLRSAGSGFGTGFPSGDQNRCAQLLQGERAGVLSVIFLISYSRWVFRRWSRLFSRGRGNLFTTARELARSFMVLAALALIGTLGVEKS